MRVFLIADYFTPFNPGGSEWSIYYLSKSLKEKKVDSIVVTPNYGAKPKEIVDGISVIRLPFFKKIKQLRSVVNPIWQNNPIFFLWSGYFLIKLIDQEKPQILHVNGKFMIPGAWIAAKVRKVPLVVSIRDKQILCSYGRCFLEDNRYHACGWIEYLTNDLNWFFNNYVQKKNVAAYLYVLISAIWTRVANLVIAFFAKRADQVIAISFSQQKYLEENGFKNVITIYNSMPMQKNKNTKNKKGILFAGKISLGKGAYLLLKAIPQVIKKYPEIFFFAGGLDDPVKFKKAISELKIEKNIKLLGGVDHHKLQKLYAESKLVVMPSIFPEAFGRVALESLAAGTPVVVVDKGGLPEIIDNNKNGLVAKTTAKSLAQSIIKILEEYPRFKKYTNLSRTKLTVKFEKEPILKQIELYNSLV